jgi:hypothetical protein
VAAGLFAAGATAGEQETAILHAAPPPLAYDASAHELDPGVARGLHVWERQEVEKEIRARIATEKARRELMVNFYRIGHTLAFPLPLAASPAAGELPAGIRGRRYPWHTWLSWALEERWRLLHAAWRRFDDRDAGLLLQRELAALAGWDSFCEIRGGVSLSTAHLAACLAQALADPAGWDGGMFRQARAAAETLLEREAWPWFQKTWPAGRELKPVELHNLSVIALTRTTQLARIVGSPRAAALDERTREVARAWCRLRIGGTHHTEGNSYDGYLMDSLTEWCEGLPDRHALQAECREALASVADEWIHLALPGRPDLHAPLGDVEPEMPFWQTALARLAAWYRRPENAWLVRRLPVSRMPAACLVEALGSADPGPADGAPPVAGLHEHPHALSLRTGWDSGDVLAAVGLARSVMSHLHADAGQLVIGWQNRFWITDAGYQQYRPGEEREFTVGVEAHNAPVIGGRAQLRRAPRLLARPNGPGREQRAEIDLTACYADLPAGASVRREIRLLPDAGPAVVVRDLIRGLDKDTEVRTQWLVGTHLAWAFRQGWARLSDGRQAMWIGTFPGTVTAAGLERHPGSRGPLTLRHTVSLPDGSAERWWVFACAPHGSWEPLAGQWQAAIRQWMAKTAE